MLGRYDGVCLVRAWFLQNWRGLKFGDVGNVDEHGIWELWLDVGPDT
jgi:hypothetical protein